jgi:hypothetical protein
MSEETNEFLDRSDLDFIRDVLIDALDQRRDDLIPRLFKLYEEVRAPEPTIPSTSDILGNINITTTEFPDGSKQYDFTAAAGDVAIGGFSDDVISFGDYTS